MSKPDEPFQSMAIVVPVYEDVTAASVLFSELGRIYGETVLVVAVDDGSVRAPVSVQVLNDAGLCGVVLTLRRNVGHQRAIAVGLNYLAEFYPSVPRIVVMDSDGEDRPASIEQLVACISDPNVDVAVARRKSRVETWRFKFFYVLFRRLFHLLSGRSINFGNFMAMKPSGLQRLTAMQELWVHVAATLLLSRLRLTQVDIDRGPRYAGKSKMNFVGLALHGFKAMMVFAEDVLVRVGILCALIVGLSTIAFVGVIVLKAIGFATPGWFSVALGILAIVFLQGGALALMTLMSLMLSGVVRGGAVAVVAYQEFVASIVSSDKLVSSNRWSALNKQNDPQH